jgi:hypothetical protein
MLRGRVETGFGRTLACRRALDCLLGCLRWMRLVRGGLLFREACARLPRLSRACLWKPVNVVSTAQYLKRDGPTNEPSWTLWHPNGANQHDDGDQQLESDK